MEITENNFIYNLKMQAIIIVRLYGSPFTICCICVNRFMVPDSVIYKSLSVKNGDILDVDIIKGKKKSLRLKTSALFLQPFVRACVNSNIYRSNVISNLRELSGSVLEGSVFLKLILEPPDKEIIDYSWNQRILRLVWTKVEIENAFSWLSTLGGAYSALGDYFEECAEEAGRISIRQYKLSKMIGDDSLVARSCLYSALSYSQKGNLRLSRHIVRQVVDFGIRTRDKRLVRMCQGVWAKLKYLRVLQNKSQGKRCDKGDQCH